MGPFQFQDDFKKWEEGLALDYRISYGQDYYLYTQNDQDVFYGLKVHKINVGFFKPRGCHSPKKKGVGHYGRFS